MNYRVDVVGHPVIVSGEATRDHLEAVNRDMARLQLENAKLRSELTALRKPAAEATVSGVTSGMAPRPRAWRPEPSPDPWWDGRPDSLRGATITPEGGA